jgi:hypothetical protein
MNNMSKEDFEKIKSLKTEKIIDEDGNTVYLRGELPHNENGPAFISEDGLFKAYYLFGDLHRIDGPAITNDSDGSYSYFMGGVRHNPLGPAIRTDEGEEFYFYFGFQAPDKETFETRFWREEIDLKISGLDGDPKEFEEKFEKEYLQ